MIYRKSELRTREDVAVGPHYLGSKISREAFLDGDSDKDPFGSRASQVGKEGSKEYTIVDPEDVGSIGNQIVEDENVDSDEVFGEGDDEQFKGFKSRGRRILKNNYKNGSQPKKVVNDAEAMEEKNTSSETRPAGKPIGLTIKMGAGFSHEVSMDDDADEGAVDTTEDESIDEDQDEGDDDGSRHDVQRKDDRAELRRMMAEEQKTVVATISQATKADADKGKAVKQQRSTFDALLNTRIRLQKGLIAINSLSTISEAEPQPTDPVKSAEAAALKLWNTLDSLRQSIHSQSTTESSKRTFSATAETPTNSLWTQMQSQETTSLALRRTTLTKWSQKVHLASSLPTHNKLNNTSSRHPLTSILDAQLSLPNIDRLIKRTRVPRSCAPIQANQSQKSPEEDPSIYDDADFYTALLRELVDQRMADSSNTTTTNGTSSTHVASAAAFLPSTNRHLHMAKMRKKVDTKASKGRKIRYTVHEKLQNFMAPEDRGMWGERQIDELFGSLLGRKRVVLDEGEDVEMDDEMVDREEEGLRLFRG
ncbi:rRNA-processing protein bfr2 [Schaereria dolodes]|nr:rRNA-processing protein bfr2 [Schaereria dolodes]